jgi:hypothetical protein
MGEKNQSHHHKVRQTSVMMNEWQTNGFLKH